MSITDLQTEELRQSFRPEKVRVLFVGESAPASERFFYRGNSQAYRCFSDCLSRHLAVEETFLNAFRARGFFLDDLIPTPVNRMSEAERRALRARHIPDLARRIAECRPEIVVSFMRGIRSEVDQAIRRSGVQARHHSLPFPGNGQQIRFKDALRELLPELL